MIQPPKQGVGPRRIWSDLQRPAVGELLEYRRGRTLRSAQQGMAGVDAAERQRRLLRGLCRRQGQGLAHRLRRQRDCALRSGLGKFESFPSNKRNASVRQLLGKPGELWGAESGTDRLVVVRD